MISVSRTTAEPTGVEHSPTGNHFVGLHALIRDRELLIGANKPFLANQLAFEYLC